MFAGDNRHAVHSEQRDRKRKSKIQKNEKSMQQAYEKYEQIRKAPDEAANSIKGKQK